MKTIVEYVLQSKTISLINEYLISKKKNKISSENFNIDMTPDDVLYLLDYNVKELSIGEYYTSDPKENEIFLMKGKNAFEGKDIKFMLGITIYLFSFSGNGKLIYIHFEDLDDSEVDSASNDDEIIEVLDRINKELHLK